MAVNSEAGSRLFPNRDLVFSPYGGNHVHRDPHFFWCPFFLAFGACSSGNWRARLFFAVDMVVFYLLICACLDLANVAFHRWLSVSYSLHFSAIASGLLGFAVYSFKLLERGFMPGRIFVEHRPVKMTRAILRLAVTTAIAAATSISVGSMNLDIVANLRSWTLLGGIGPGVFLFLPVFFGQLYLLAIWDVMTAKKEGVFAPRSRSLCPLTMNNTSLKIRSGPWTVQLSTIEATFHILIMNNNSTDDTEEIASKTLASCVAAKGRVINVPKPGKSNALNAGLDAVETEFFVRVDADTLIGEDNLSRAMPFFTDPQVGVVGGVPIPPGGALVRPCPSARSAGLKHGFLLCRHGGCERRCRHTRHVRCHAHRTSALSWRLRRRHERRRYRSLTSNWRAWISFGR